MDHLYCGKCSSRPNTGRSFFEETKADLLSKYLKVSPDKAGMYIRLHITVIVISNFTQAVALKMVQYRAYSTLYIM